MLVTTDESCPDPGEVADTILETMREEYPELEDDPFEEVVNERLVSGYDVEFFSLDLPNTARIRCFRTLTRTILIFGQWSDLVEAEVSDLADSDHSARSKTARTDPAGFVDHSGSTGTPLSTGRLFRGTPRSGREAARPPLSMTSMCFAPATSNQCGGDRERIGEAASFVDRDDRVVRPVNDHGRDTCTPGAVCTGPGRSMRHARQLARATDHQPGQELGNGSRRLRRTVAVDATRSTMGDSSTRATSARIERRGPQGDRRAHRAAPEHRLERQAPGRSVPAGPRAHRARPGYRPPRGRRTSKNGPRSGRGRENRAPRRSSRVGSEPPRGLPRAPTRSRRTRAAEDRPPGDTMVPCAGNQRATRRAPSPALASIGSTSAARSRVCQPRRPRRRDRSVRHDQRPGADLDDRQDQAGERPQDETRPARPAASCPAPNDRPAADRSRERRQLSALHPCRRRSPDRAVSSCVPFSSRNPLRDDAVVGPS